MVTQDSPSNPTQPSCNLQQLGTQNYDNVFPPDLPNNNTQFLGGRMQPRSTGSRHFMDLLGASNDVHNQPQKLSLSLFPPSVQCRETSLNQNIMNNNPGFMNYSLAGSSALAAPIADSKYLRPALELLEEVASVGGQDPEVRYEKLMRRLSRNSKNGSLGVRSAVRIDFPTNELEAKIMKLITMLEEVERRYEQYCHQMEELVSSFEAISGKSYTALALEAMSKHFCSLRDAIIAQINATRRRLSEETPTTGLHSHFSLFHPSSEAARLQKLSLQHLGLIQSSRQTWRPIRGLPETSVAILRAWLFQHFLHPYPNDSEKLILASQTGLSKNQVSNWFINARVRLWKPMIEEMYKEEFAAESSSADECDNLFGGSSTRSSRTTTQGPMNSAEE
ncbi:PREDICTED: BEL1-like homeodomain protein 11 [Ipomoea nil]|uniref:BEL1-like homeodomain protein 11 n=1 Tax=Ipomoea nil TaxID=35883 RepID=UPI00090178D7|nr:PREDICTED: BEL1-like homeodomain protein 11 [Ipomoea nil]